MKRVLFLCPHNALRSVIAAALFNQAAAGRAVAESGGTEPDERVNERTIQVLREVGIDAAGITPERVDRAMLERADRIVGLNCPLPPELTAAAAGKIEEWAMPDTTGKPVEAVREVRELIRARIERLLAEMTREGEMGEGEMGEGEMSEELTLDEVRARMRAAGLEIAEARLSMVRGLLELGLGPVRAMDTRAFRTLEPAVTFDATGGPTEGTHGSR